jgi:hypothetical protein
MREISLNPELVGKLVARATKFRDFRLRCVEYLDRHGVLADKFTVTNNDRLIGFLAEHVLAQELPRLYPKCVFGARLWYTNPGVDLKRIDRIVKEGDSGADSLREVQEYFYDKWDLELATCAGTVQLDVKTAISARKPTLDWDFLYPVVQAKRGEADDRVLLAWCLAGDEDDIATIRSLMLVGVTTKRCIRACVVIPKGRVTRKGTVSQVDNHETRIRRDYCDLADDLCLRTRLPGS